MCPSRARHLLLAALVVAGYVMADVCLAQTEQVIRYTTPRGPRRAG
jgi:hypothetical protein